MTTGEIDRLGLMEKMLGEIHTAIVGTVGGDPGINGKLADHAARIAGLERFQKWLAGIGTAVLTALAVGAALAVSAFKR